MTGELRKPVLPSETTHPHRRGGIIVLSYKQTGLRSSHRALVSSWFVSALVLGAVVLVKQAVNAFLFLHSNPWLRRFRDI